MPLSSPPSPHTLNAELDGDPVFRSPVHVYSSSGGHAKGGEALQRTKHLNTQIPQEPKKEQKDAVRVVLGFLLQSFHLFLGCH